MSNEIVVVGGGIAGLTAAIVCARSGARVRLLEAHAELGGRARTTAGPYRANLGPHVLYKDGPMYAWLAAEKLLPAIAGPPLSGIRLRFDGAIHRMPPLAMMPPVLRLRGREAPVDLSFREWVTRNADARTAELLAAAAGVYTFHHDPGELSAAFVWPRTIRTLLTPLPAARYAIGGWGALVDRLVARVRELGVTVETGARVEALPDGPVVVATELAQAATLLGDPSLSWPSGRTLTIDLGLRSRRGDPFLVSDLDDGGWVERFSAADRTLAPEGEELIQGQMPVRPDESTDAAAARLEALLDLTLEDRGPRETWRRRQLMDGRSGALDMPGLTWRDRPAIDRGDGVALAGDMVAAEGLLSEVAWASGMQAARVVLAAAGGGRLVGAA